MNILISSGHYFLSSKYGTELKWGIDLANEYAVLGHRVVLVGTVADYTKHHSGIIVLKLFTKRSQNLLVEIILRTLHPVISGLLSCYAYYFIFGRQVHLVHHVAPISKSAWDLMFLLKPGSPQTKYVIGPALSVPPFGGPKDLVEGLGTKPAIYSYLLWLLARISLPFIELLGKKTITRSDYLVCATSQAVDYYSEVIKPNKIQTIPIGVGQDFFIPNHKAASKSNITIISVSRLIPRKGIDVLIKAFTPLISDKELSSFNLRLMVVGTGDQADYLHQLSRDNKIEKYVEFTGFIDHNHLPSVYAKADIFCSPTLDEPYGMTILEAMATGLPIIVSDVSSTKKLIGNAGLTFPASDVATLTTLLKKLILNYNYRKQLRKFAITKSKKDYNWSSVAKRYLSLINFDPYKSI